MKLRRAALVQHLQKIACNGQIKEAVFAKGFATTALSEDHLLLVLAPSLPKVEPLEDEIGLADLALVIKSLGMVVAEGNEGVDVLLRVEDHRLVIDEVSREARLVLLTASPKTIGTRVEAATVEKLMAKAPEGKGIPLTRSLIEGIRDTFAGFKVEEIELTVGPKGGQVRVGNELGHYAEFPSKDLKSKTPYAVLFGKHFVDVLTQITDYSEAQLLLGGTPEAFVLIEDGAYQYLLSPRSRSADEKKKPAKAKGEKREKAEAVE